jgi:hypothetical protein
MVMIAVGTARLIAEPEPTSMLQNSTLPVEHTFAQLRARMGKEQREVSFYHAALKVLAATESEAELKLRAHVPTQRCRHKQATMGGEEIDLSCMPTLDVMAQHVVRLVRDSTACTNFGRAQYGRMPADWRPLFPLWPHEPTRPPVCRDVQHHVCSTRSLRWTPAMNRDEDRAAVQLLATLRADPELAASIRPRAWILRRAEIDAALPTKG